MNFNSFFRGDNFVFRWSNDLVNVVLLSIVWLFLSVPIVTAGPATAALYFTVVKCLRGGEDRTYLHYWRSFRENLRVGIPATLVSGAVLLLLSVGLEVLRVASAADDRLTLMYLAYYFLAVLPVGLICYLFPLLGRFQFRFGQLFSTAFLLSLKHLPSTILMVAMVVLAANLCLRWFYLVLILPGLVVLMASFFLERIFKKYLPEEETVPEEDEYSEDE